MQTIHVVHYPYPYRIVVNQEVIGLVQVVFEHRDKILSVFRKVIARVYLLDSSSCVGQLVELDAASQNGIFDVGKAFKHGILYLGYSGN